MNRKKLKMALYLCIIGVILLFVAMQIHFKEKKTEKGSLIVSSVDMEAIGKVNSREKINYDDPSPEEREYLKKAYGSTVAFTSRGTEIYMERAFSGPINKIITCKWPESELVSLIPKPDFGELDRIEYQDAFLRVFLEKAKSSDISQYGKQLKKLAYQQAKEKIDSDTLLKYQYANEAGNNVIITYYKLDKRCEIDLKK